MKVKIMNTCKPFYDCDIIVVLVTEEDHIQMKANSQVECSIVNGCPSSLQTSTGNPDIVLSI